MAASVADRLRGPVVPLNVCFCRKWFYVSR